MVKQKQLEGFMEKHINYCSFTYWSKDAAKVVTYSDIKEKFSDKFVFVALNPTKSCHAFHSGSPQDENLINIFANSNNVYYITDLFKLDPELFKDNKKATDSRSVVKWLKEEDEGKGKDKTMLNSYIETLKTEISLIGGNPTIVAFGDAVYRLLLENKCKLCNCESPIKIEKVLHFSRNSPKKVKGQLEGLHVFEKYPTPALNIYYVFKKCYRFLK